MLREKRLRAALGTALIGMAICSSARAVSFTGSYAENFDSVASPGTALGPVAWTNNTTIAGWSAYYSGGATAGYTTGGAPTTVSRNSTTASPAPIYLWKSSAASSDVALGSANFNGSSAQATGYNSYGVTLTNNSGKVITELSLSYDAEKYVGNYGSTTLGTNPDPISVSYAIGATGIADADAASGWTPTALGYNVTYPTSANVYDVTPASPSGTLPGLTWNPGETLVVRWVDVNVDGNDRGTGIDNVVIAAVPEPATLSVIGAGFAGLLGRRRRHAFAV